MKTLTEFITSLQSAQPYNGLSPQLKALWYVGKGNWNGAHAQIDQLNDRESAWVHAYLHRKEGDIFNADYWYKRAGQIRPAISLEEEWEQLVQHFIS